MSELIISSFQPHICESVIVECAQLVRETVLDAGHRETPLLEHPTVRRDIITLIHNVIVAFAQVCFCFLRIASCFFRVMFFFFFFFFLSLLNFAENYKLLRM